MSSNRSDPPAPDAPARPPAGADDDNARDHAATRDDEAPDHDAILARRQMLIRAAQEPRPPGSTPSVPLDPAPGPCLAIAPPAPCLKVSWTSDPGPDSDPPPEARVAARRTLRHGPRVPGAPPAWFSPRAIASLAVGVGVALVVLRVAYLSVEDRPRPELPFELVLPVALVGAVAAVSVAMAAVARGAIAAGARAFAGAGLASVVPTLAILTPALGARDAPGLQFFLLGPLLGGFFGALVALVAAPVLVATSRARRRPAHDGPDAALAVTGAWLAVASLIAGALATRVAWGPGPLPELVVATAGSALFLVARRRVKARLAWLARVRRGEVPGWRVARSTECSTPTDALPVLMRVEPHPGPERHDGVLLASDPSATGPSYRGARDERPAARVAFDGATDALAKRVLRAYLVDARTGGAGQLVALVVVLVMALACLLGFFLAMRGAPVQRVG